MDKERLRYLAEEMFKQHGIQDKELFKKDIQQLVEELSIYQIELEHQNQELRFSQQELLNINQKYQDIFNNAPVAYFIIDSNYKIIDVNKTAAEMLDVPIPNIKGNNFTRFIHPAFQDTFYFHFNKTFEKNKDNCFVKLKKNDNTYFFAKLVSQLDKTGNKNLLRIAAINIQKEKELEIALTEEKNKTQEQQNYFSQFIQQVLKEITNKITEQHQKFESDNIATENNQSKTECENYFNSLMEIINDVNEIISLNAHNIQPHKKSINLNNLFNTIFIYYEKNVRQKKLQYYLNKKTNRNDYLVVADEKILSTIISKLIENAIKYAQSGNIEFGFEIHLKGTDLFVTHHEEIINEDIIETFNDIFKTPNFNSFKHFETLGHRLTLIFAYVKLLHGEMELLKTNGNITFKISLPI